MTCELEILTDAAVSVEKNQSGLLCSSCPCPAPFHIARRVDRSAIVLQSRGEPEKLFVTFSALQEVHEMKSVLSKNVLKL